MNLTKIDSDNAIRVLATTYRGIYIVEEENWRREEYRYWIQDDSGGEQYYGQQFPTDQDIDEYRDAII